jgi:AcrR family transcriptional regulator
MRRPPPPPLRSDAARNRDLVLEAAEAAFGEEGTDASTEAIARRAGVGAGTLFRHFPTKEKLLEAVLERMVERLDTAARRCLDTRDPGEALFSALYHLVEGTAAKKAVVDALSSAGVDVRAHPSMSPLWKTLGELLSRAQAAGAARRDVGVKELVAVVIAAARAAQFARQDRALRERVVGVVLDGLRHGV